jgi:hypothetical protein
MSSMVSGASPSVEKQDETLNGDLHGIFDLNSLQVCGTVDYADLSHTYTMK